MNELVILGTDHFAQPIEMADNFRQFPDSSNCHREQVEHYSAFLKQLIEKHGITLIAEEFRDNIATAAKTLIGSNRWTSINTSDEERRNLGMVIDYRTAYPPEKLSLIDRKREEIMAERILQFAKNGQNILVICGAEHVRGLEKILQSHFKIIKQAVMDQPWYEHPKQRL